ncbi:unnamed protein product [Rhizophagus irregularis]|nr:unnamed protein product [Rhizophagus irregularis]
MKSHIYQSADITDSDHNITFTKISFTDIIVTNNKGGRRAEKNTKRIVYDYENTTNEQWNEYENYLKSLLEKHKAFRYIETHGRNEDTLNKLWDIICKCIQQASLKHIPHKKNELKGAELLKASKGIKTFNERYGTNISELTEDTDWHTWKCETRNWLKIVRRVIKMKDKECKEATIKRRIEERNNMITTDQRKMINNILDKTYSKINLDRIRIVTDTQEEILLNTKEEVQAEAINAFSSLFRARNHKFENLSEQWKTIYEPRTDINPQIYDHLGDTPTEQEWNEMLNTMNDSSAPGISNISYKLIKKAGIEVNKLFRQYTARTCPILLIECLRKCAVKIITKRLGSILSRHEILKGPNYAGLPGELTSTPLTMINSILEDARKENKTEDESLGYSMELKWPYNTICNEKRNVRIRTAASAYADDTQWIAKIVNPDDNNEEERFIEIGKNRDKVTANKGSVPIRILGVWFKADKGDKHTEGIVKKEISTVLGAIRRKHITHMQAIYIINTVLLPRLEYRLKTTIWEDKKYEEIYKPIMKVVKHKTQLPINCHNNILLHSAQENLKNLWRNQTAAQITEFLVALNSQSKQADMLKMRLKKAQLTLNITSCILMTDPDVTVPNKMLNNHAYNVIRKAHDYLFKIHPLVESEEWNIPIIGLDVRNFVYQQASELQKKDKEFIIRKAAALSIHGALQLLNHDASNTITWQQICDINKRQAREPSNSERETEIDREALINMQAFKMTKKMPSKDSRKKEFVYTHQDGTLVWGQIIKKNNKTGKFTIQHWVRNSNNQSEDSGIMQKVIQRCSGCRLNDRRVNKESYNCHFNRDYSDLACINRIFSCQNNSDTKVIKDIIETRKCPGRQCISEQISDRIQIQDYDTALIRNTVSNEEARTQHITLLHQLRSIFNPSNTIDIYTDGSLTDRFNTNLNDFTKHMGTDWPSSTHAELGAILSAILVLQTGQRANIFTDSQAAIDSINHTRINLTNGKNKIRIWCKSNNYSIISSIINLIDSKHLEIKLIKVKGHSGVKGNEEADRVAKNDTGKSTCITINDSQQKDLKYDLYWDGKRVDRHIRKFIDNLCGSALEASWSFNRTHRTIFQDTTHMIEEKVTWAIFKKNTGFNCTTTTVNNNFIKHLKLTNNLLPTLEIMKERRYDLYGDVKCRLCLVENEDDDHIIYCQQLRDKWLIMANNTINKCEQMLKDFLSKKEYIQLNQEDIQQLHLWNRNFFVHTTGFNQELPIPFVHLMLRNLFPKGRYRELRSIVKSEKATLTIASLFLEMFITEFYKVIWQPRCDIVADWEHTKGIKKQDLRKKISAQQRIVYERIPTQQVEDGTYDLKGRKIFKRGEQWSVALEKTRQYINQFIKNGNRRVVKAFTKAI